MLAHMPIRRLLVVDDDLDLGHFVIEALNEEGWDVRAATSGPEALQILQTWRPDVILLDMVLPVMSARSFRAELDNSEALRNIPLVVMSGVADMRYAVRPLRASAALPKPFNLDSLVRVVRRVT